MRPALNDAAACVDRRRFEALPPDKSVRSLTFKPCVAKWRVNGVLSCMPLKSLGEKTSNGSDTVCVISVMPSWAVSYSVNINRKTPGRRTDNLANIHNAPGFPSMWRSLSGVWMTSPAVTSAPVGVLTAAYTSLLSSWTVGSAATREARIKNVVESRRSLVMSKVNLTDLRIVLSVCFQLDYRRWVHWPSINYRSVLRRTAIHLSHSLP